MLGESVANRSKKKFEIFLWILAMSVGLCPVTMNNWRGSYKKVPLSPPGSTEETCPQLSEPTLHGADT